jgi:hypothetical protein
MVRRAPASWAICARAGTCDAESGIGDDLGVDEAGGGSPMPVMTDRQPLEEFLAGAGRHDAPDVLELWDWTLAPWDRHDSEAHGATKRREQVRAASTENSRPVALTDSTAATPARFLRS